MKMPGVYAAYAGILTVFGQTHRGIHIALILMNFMTVIMMYLIVRRLFEKVRKRLSLQSEKYARGKRSHSGRARHIRQKCNLPEVISHFLQAELSLVARIIGL